MTSLEHSLYQLFLVHGRVHSRECLRACLLIYCQQPSHHHCHFLKLILMCINSEHVLINSNQPPLTILSSKQLDQKHSGAMQTS